MEGMNAHNGPRPGLAIWKSRPGRTEMCIRIFASLNLTGCSIALLAALVANYTVSLSDVTNNASVTIISGSYLQYSVSLFGGIFFTLTLLTAIYHIMWIIVRHLNFGCINNNPKIFGIIDVIVTGICLAVMTAGIAGSLLVATRLSNYSSVADGVQVPSAMIAGMWAAFGFYIGGYSNTYNLNIQMVRFVTLGTNKVQLDYEKM